MYKGVLLILFTLMAASVMSLSQSETVKVQVINNSPDPNTGNVMVSVDGEIKGPTGGLGFRQATPFFEVQALNDYVKVEYGGESLLTNIPPVGAVAIVIGGVKTPSQYHNPYSRDLKLKDDLHLAVKTDSYLGRIWSGFFNGATDAPPLTIKDRKHGDLWADSVDYFYTRNYPSIPDIDPRVYKMDVFSALDMSYIV